MKISAPPSLLSHFGNITSSHCLLIASIYFEKSSHGLSKLPTDARPSEEIPDDNDSHNDDKKDVNISQNEVLERPETPLAFPQMPSQPSHPSPIDDEDNATRLKEYERLSTLARKKSKKAAGEPELKPEPEKSNLTVCRKCGKPGSLLPDRENADEEGYFDLNYWHPDTGTKCFFSRGIGLGHAIDNERKSEQHNHKMR